LDTERREAVAAVIRARHSARIPRGAMGEMAVIRGEAARKRSHMAIRKLIQRAGRTVQAIKPVFMMSPISVAQYLAPGAVSFDLVVIDEASQVRPEDALGLIARAGQVVVVGDRKQLPPTSFFSRLLTDEVDDEDDEQETAPLAGAARATELESILTLCDDRGLPNKMLRWHYRSRHHSLIEVSNAEFYGANLFLPPSPSTSRGAEGLVLRRVNGAYDRGGKRPRVRTHKGFASLAVS
jgi:superfamily I DNA and/or RNA helicase